jgi:hypothetical protein
MQRGLDEPSAARNKRLRITSVEVGSTGVTNVLALHKAKNGNTQNIPTTQQLSTHMTSMTSSNNHPVNVPFSTSHPHLQSTRTDNLSPNSSSQRSHHARLTHKSRRRSGLESTPAQLGFYSPRSKSILRDAKMKYRIYVATETPFPTTAQSLECATKSYNMSSDEYARDTDTDREIIPAADRGRLQVVSL